MDSDTLLANLTLADVESMIRQEMPKQPLDLLGVTSEEGWLSEGRHLILPTGAGRAIYLNEDDYAQLEERATSG